MRFFIAIALLLFVSLFAACEAPEKAPVGGEEAAVEEAWTQTSLLLVEPELRGGGSVEIAPPKQELVLLGRGARRFQEKAERTGAGRIAGEIRALDFQVGPEMQWEVELGREPYLSFVPLGRPSEECTLYYRVRVLSAEGSWTVLRQIEAIDHENFAPANVHVSLQDYAGQKVRLGLKAGVEEPGCGKLRASWGNPAVFSRKPPPSVAEVEGEEASSARRPNILLLGLDTLRADALGVYGRSPSPTPAIDRLAAEGDVWLEAYSAFNITNPSFTSIHTGLYGKNHGIYDLSTPLPASYDTLAESFSAAGWKTGAVVSARHLEADRSGLDQGFDELITAGKQLAAEDAVDRAMHWLSRHQASQEEPFFFWLHLFDPHTPHTPPEPFASGRHSPAPRLGLIDDWQAFREEGTRKYRDRRLGGEEDLYASEVAYLDHQLGRLLDFLQSHGLMENTWIVLTADHGENLGEYGIDFRHTGLWDTVSHVPLILRPPGGSEARRIPGLVQSFDLFPTLLRIADLPVPEQDGLDLYGEEKRRAVFMENAVGNGMGVRSEDFLYFYTLEDRGGLEAGRFLYDLRNDPGQEVNLAGKDQELEERMHALLERWSADRREGERAEASQLNAEELEQLRALGYLD